MSYIGNTPGLKYTSFAVQHFTTSATTGYTLDHAVSNENEIRLVINNVVQQPGSGKAYTASGTTLTLSAATASTDAMYCVFLGKAVQTLNPATDSVGTSQIADNAVTDAKLADATQGDILYYGASGAPAQLSAGTSGYYLKTQGASANPVWAEVSAGTSWQSAQTSTFTAATGKGYPVNTSGSAITVNLPAGAAGNYIVVTDYAGTFGTNNCTIAANGSEKINGSTDNIVCTYSRASYTLTYVDATQGWIATSARSPQSGLIHLFDINNIDATYQMNCSSIFTSEYRNYKILISGDMDVDGETPRLQWQNANTGGHIDSADYRYVYHGYEVTSSGGGSTALATGSVGNNWNIFGDLQDNGNAYHFNIDMDVWSPLAGYDDFNDWYPVIGNWRMVGFNNSGYLYDLSASFTCTKTDAQGVNGFKLQTTGGSNMSNFYARFYAYADKGNFDDPAGTITMST